MTWRTCVTKWSRRCAPDTGRCTAAAATSTGRTRPGTGVSSCRWRFADASCARSTRPWLTASKTHRRPPQIGDALPDAVRVFFCRCGDRPDAGRCVDCNRRRCLYGAGSRERLIGLQSTDVSPPRQPDGTDSREIARRHLEEASARGSCTFEAYRRPDSNEVPQPKSRSAQWRSMAGR